MTSSTEHERFQELLGVYALDAVEPDEAAEIEAHLAGCARCAAEVDKHRETVALLASSETTLRLPSFDKIAAAIRPAKVTPLRRSVPVWALAAAAAVAVLLGAVAVDQNRRAERMQDQLASGSLVAAARAAAAAPGARTVVLTSGGGAPYAEVSMLPDGRAYLVARDLPTLPDGRSYQLWALRGPDRTSLVVAGTHPTAVAFRTAPDVDGFALTEEVAGGAPQPTRAPVAVAFLREI